ncbi:hypothetical protein LTR62_001204 [Meristemomyces frigidus]|uniref:Uncharacterized protein n=1 Tax=Meristemomyces frigidus TaxID=1508187 RepID=A0AAN7YQP2_9PEZI|nr:hypothetical protein LTR62_001204 [Meristemomyces frigidus]
MATKQANGVPKKPAAPRAPVRKPAGAKSVAGGYKKPAPPHNKAASVAGGENAGGGTSAYAIMANRIANRVAEMAESITFVERQQPSQQQTPLPETPEDKKKPRKLEMRLNGGSADSIAFSAPFLDNTLQKMLQLQNRMLKSSAQLSAMEGADEKIIKEHAAQSAELSRIIALICAEKARQGA